MSKYKIHPFFKKGYPITQRYGDNPSSYLMFQISGHEGIDYGTPNGTEVISPFDGFVLRDSINDKDYGNFTVIWDRTQQCALWFCHLQNVTTKIGDKVVVGQLIGYTNNTGHSTGPHCHVNFVETDNAGNRLNTNNGKQGFLNLLDPSLVEFITDSPPVIINPQPQQPMDQKYSFRQVIQFYYRILCNVDPSEDEYKHWEDMQKGGWNEIQIGIDILNNDSRSPVHGSNLANLTIKQLAQAIVDKS